MAALNERIETQIEEQENCEVYGYANIEEALEVVGRYVCEWYSRCGHGVRRIDCAYCGAAREEGQGG